MEPQPLLVRWGRRWYMLARDTHWRDWRTFPVDRLDSRTPTGPRFTPTTCPTAKSSPTHAGHVVRGMHAPAETVAERIPTAVGLLEAVDEHTCLLDTGADTFDALAVYRGMLGVDLEVSEPPDLIEYIRKLADRYRRATR